MYVMPEMDVLDIVLTAPILAGSNPLDPDEPNTNIGDVDEDEIG